MTVTSQVSVLADGFESLYADIPSTHRECAELWAASYTGWLRAGGITAASTREAILVNGWTAAFLAPTVSETLNLFYQTLVTYWLPGMPIPPGSTLGQASFPATSLAYAPAGIPIANPAFESEDPRELAEGLAQFVSGITLLNVSITVAAAPPYVAPLTP